LFATSRRPRTATGRRQRWQGTGGTVKYLVLSEDLAQPKNEETTRGYQDATAATFAIFIDDWSLISSGQTIVVRPGKTVTAITVGVPNRAIGQYKASTDTATTRTDLIATINDVTFASGVFAAPDPDDGTRINCTKTTLGARGNEAVTESTNGVTITGNAVGGYDAFGEIYLARHQDYADVTLPNVSTYDTTHIRTRYLSKTIAISTKRTLTVIVHGAVSPYYRTPGTHESRIGCESRMAALGSDFRWQHQRNHLYSYQSLGHYQGSDRDFR
jgi:hypothetical protein